MKIKSLILSLLVGISFASCIQDEPLNAECDILSCIVEGDILKMDPRIENDRIYLMITPSFDLQTTDIVLDFILTPGATIDPPSGTPRNFSEPQTYVVTSEDKQWHKTYTISCNNDGITTEYSFEHYELNSNQKYYIFYDVINDKKQYIWASANAAFEIIGGKTLPEDYPTAPYPFGVEGNCVRLETKSTGLAGQLVKMPIAAGSLFIGEFIAKDSMKDPLSATHFGVPFSFIPVRLKGYYKYKPGPVFTDGNNKVVEGETDSFDLYSILYETDDEVKYLDGSNFLTSPNLISIARIKEEDKVVTDEWTSFSVYFKLQPGKTIDLQKLNEGKYNVSIVMSSSINGDLFRGAVGSVLLVDEVELVHF